MANKKVIAGSSSAGYENEYYAIRAELARLGLDSRYSVVDSNGEWKLLDRITGKKYSNLGEALTAAKADADPRKNQRSREKNVQNVAPVTVKKSAKNYAGTDSFGNNKRIPVGGDESSGQVAFNIMSQKARQFNNRYGKQYMICTFNSASGSPYITLTGGLSGEFKSYETAERVAIDQINKRKSDFRTNTSTNKGGGRIRHSDLHTSGKMFVHAFVHENRIVKI